MKQSGFRLLVNAFRAGMKQGGDHADRVLAPTMASLVSRAAGTTPAPSESPETPPPAIEGTSRRVREGGGARIVVLLLLSLSAVAVYLAHLPDSGVRGQLYLAPDEDERPAEDEES